MLMLRGTDNRSDMDAVRESEVFALRQRVRELTAELKRLKLQLKKGKK